MLSLRPNVLLNFQVPQLKAELDRRELTYSNAARKTDLVLQLLRNNHDISAAKATTSTPSNGNANLTAVLQSIVDFYKQPTIILNTTSDNTLEALPLFSGTPILEKVTNLIRDLNALKSRPILKSGNYNESQLTNDKVLNRPPFESTHAPISRPIFTQFDLKPWRFEIESNHCISKWF